jgi:hypothetical protein
VKDQVSPLDLGKSDVSSFQPSDLMDVWAMEEYSPLSPDEGDTFPELATEVPSVSQMPMPPWFQGVFIVEDTKAIETTWYSI